MNAIWYDLAGSNNHKCQKLFYFLLSSLKQSEATKWAFQIILKLRFFTSLEGIKVFALAKSFEQFYIERKLEKPIFNSLLRLCRLCLDPVSAHPVQQLCGYEEEVWSNVQVLSSSQKQCFKRLAIIWLQASEK